MEQGPVDLQDYILKHLMFDINVTFTLVSYIKSEISDWRTGAWFLKYFKGRVEENHYL